MVGTDAPVDRTRCDVRFDFLVQFEVVLLGQDVDLGTGCLFPIGNARIKRFVLLTADQLGVNCNAFKFARKFRSPRGNHPCSQQHRTCQHRCREISHASPPLDGQLPCPPPIVNCVFICKHNIHTRSRRFRCVHDFRHLQCSYMKKAIHEGDEFGNR